MTATFENHESVAKTPKHTLLTAIEAANELRIHPVTLLRWAREGRIPHLRLGRKVLFSIAQVNDWINASYTGSTVLTASTERKAA